MAKYLDESVRKYLDDLSARLPAPGGGSASALAAATGVGLLAMAANFTLGKKGYESCQEKIKIILEKLGAARLKLQELIDLDVEAYGRISKVYGLPKNTVKERIYRDEQVQAALKEAMLVPLDIFNICGEMIEAADSLADIANKNLISDVGCGALFLGAAMKSAKLNVDINLKSIKDAGFVSKTRSGMEQVIRNCSGISENVFLKTEKEVN